MWLICLKDYAGPSLWSESGPADHPLTGSWKIKGSPYPPIFFFFDLFPQNLPFFT